MKVFSLPALKTLSALLLIAIFVSAPALSDAKRDSETAGKTALSSRSASPYGPWGFDLSGMNINVAPGDDFYQFANGAWLDGATIATSDRSYGAQRVAQKRVWEQRRELVAGLLSRSWPAQSDEAKFLKIYQSYLDRKRINEMAGRPARPFFKYLADTRSDKAIARAIGNIHLDAPTLFEINVRIDPQGKGVYLPSLEMPELLLGTRHHYTRQGEHFAALRIAIADELVALLRYTGQRRNLVRRVQAVLELETKLAALHPSESDLRNPSRDNVFVSLDQLEELYPAFPWREFFSQSGVDDTSRIHMRLGPRVAEITELFRATPNSVWRDYLRLKFTIRYGPILSDPVVRQVERFHAIRRGTEPPVRTPEDLAARLADQLMPDVLARAYLDTSSTDNRLEAVQAMSEAIRSAYRQHILAASWLSTETKERALAKLEAVKFIVGGSPGQNEYARYIPAKEKLFDNVYWARQLRKQAALARLGSRKDTKRPDVDILRSRLFFSSLRVGAYYLPRLNTIIIPANYLQPPYYDPAADMAVNFGALGSTIGHELGHAFDDQGAQYGPDGQRENWWLPEDRARFEVLGQRLSEQFAAYEAAPGVQVNTALTLGENMSDLTGLAIAYSAYREYQITGGETLVDDKEAKRRFFLGYAQKRRVLRRPDYALELALVDPHSPAPHRVNGIVRNLDFWYDAFDVGPEHGLWLDPDDRVTVW